MKNKPEKTFIVRYTEPMWDERIVRASSDAEARRKVLEILADARIIEVQEWDDSGGYQ